MPDKRALFEQQRDWCLAQREEAVKALDLYKRGTMSFRINGVDATQEQIRNLRRIIENMDALIERIERHLA